MTIYVDPLFKATPRTVKAQRHGRSWCHLITDGDLEELHEFAEKIGLKRSYFQRAIIPHYDLTPSKRALAVKEGAIEKSANELAPIRKQWRMQWNGGEPSWEKKV